MSEKDAVTIFFWVGCLCVCAALGFWAGIFWGLGLFGLLLIVIAIATFTNPSEKKP